MDITYPMYLYFDGNNGTVYLSGYYDALIIIIIILFAGVCVSLPALIWTFQVFYTFRKHGGRISTFIIVLTMNDLADLLLSTIIASVLSISTYNTKYLVKKHFKDLIQEMYTRHFLINHELLLLIRSFTACRFAGHYLHQLVALENLLSIKSQICSAHVFTPLCSTITCIILGLIATGFQFLSPDSWLHLIVIFLPCCILAIKWVLICKASPVPDRINPGLAVMLVSTLTLIASCATAGLVFAFQENTVMYIYDSHLSQFLASFISLRVISDPLLCILVCKEQLRVRKQQTHREMNAAEITLT